MKKLRNIDLSGYEPEELDKLQSPTGPFTSIIMDELEGASALSSHFAHVSTKD